MRIRTLATQSFRQWLLMKNISRWDALERARLSNMDRVEWSDRKVWNYLITAWLERNYEHLTIRLREIQLDANELHHHI